MVEGIDYRVLLLVIIRVSSFFVVSQVFFPKGVHNIFKITFSVMFAFLIFPIVYKNINVSINGDYTYVFLILFETLIGVIIGIFVNLLFSLFSGIGAIIDSQGGFSSSQIFDPMMNNNSSIIERIFYWISLSTFILLNGHHYFIKAFILSYEKIGIGSICIDESFLTNFIYSLLVIFKSSFMIVVPIIIILTFIDIMLGVISRIIPKINMVIMSFPFKILATISLLILSVKIIFSRFNTMYFDFNELIFKVFSVAPFIFVLSDDKTEDPTPHRIKKSREEGNIAKSPFLVSSISIIGVVLVIMMGGFIINELKDIMIYFFRDGISNNYSGYDSVYVFKLIIMKVFKLIIVPCVLFLCISIISNVIQTGFVFNLKSLKFNINEFNPINTFKNIFNLKSLIDIFRDLIVVVLICYVSFKFVIDKIDDFMRLTNYKTECSFNSIVSLFIYIFIKIFVIVFTIGILDFVIEKFRYKKKLRMSKQEVKDEFKQMEGDPEVKSKIRQKGKEIIMQNIKSSIKESSVIITNPTHISVVLRYKQGEDTAPKLVAKGINHMAYKIKEIAQEYEIPIVEDKYLARFIYKNVELQEEIPQEIYKAVADILTYIFKLNNKKLR